MYKLCDGFTCTAMRLILSKPHKNRKHEKPVNLAAHRAFALFTFRQQIHCIYMYISIQMLCHMDIYNWPDKVRCYILHGK